MRRARRAAFPPLAVVLLALTACSGQAAVSPTTTAPTATSLPPTTSPPPAPPPSFSVDRALDHVREIVAFGPREASGRAHRAAAGYVADALRGFGYEVRRDRFDVPAGTVDGTAVGAGRSENVVAHAAGFDPRAPHVVIGGHLDTVPDSPGANDNASGIAVMLEIARLAVLDPPRLPATFVAFGAEERRGQGDTYSFGSRHYVASLGSAERRAVRGFLNLDMVGNGERVILIGAGALYRHVLAVGRNLGIPSGPGTAPGLFSDHLAFNDRGIESAWMWAGAHETLHTPRDTLGVVQRAQMRRVGRLAWEAVRTLQD